MLNFGVAIKAILLVLGFLWCKDVIGKLPADIQTIKEGADKAEKHVVIFYWVITAGIMAAMGYFLWGLISVFIRLGDYF